jgi:hypothetical protein
MRAHLPSFAGCDDVQIVALVDPRILGYDASAFIARMVRSRVLEVLKREYIQIAHAKGLSQRAVTFGLPFPNSGERS